jgi:hypothetical protein
MKELRDLKDLTMHDSKQTEEEMDMAVRLFGHDSPP